jgi:hypothetical protein
MPPSQPLRHRLLLFAAYATASTAAARSLPPATATVLTATVWAAFILAISFCEAWVKFKAPSLTKAAAVDAGRHVFAALNAVEAGLAVGLVSALVRGSAAGPAWRLAGVPLAALAAGLLHLTPALDARARCVIATAAGARPPLDPPPPAWLHGVYVVGEAVKVCALGALVARLGGALSEGGAAAAGRVLAGSGW